MKNHFKYELVLIVLMASINVCAADIGGQGDVKEKINQPVLALITAIVRRNSTEITRLIVKDGVNPHATVRPEGRGDTPWEVTGFKAYKNLRPVIENALIDRARQFAGSEDECKASLGTSADL